MREHDVYVLASNGYEGWGAVVSEALEEGMKVIGTYEAGSSATILPKECLFKSGDYVVLRKMLADSAGLPLLDKEIWSAKNAAVAFVALKDRIAG
jgi:glycosyltransferase involved in cell wall biosynthesis